MFLTAASRPSEALLRTPLQPIDTAPEHPSVQILIGSLGSDLLQVMRQIYKDGYMVAPSVFIHAQEEDFMKELQWKL